MGSPKKKTKSNADHGGSPHPSAASYLYIIFVTVTFCMAILWFFQIWVWGEAQQQAERIETVSKLKLLLRIETELLTELLEDDDGHLAVDSVLLKAFELRATRARDLLPGEDAKAILDELVVGLHKDVETMLEEKRHVLRSSPARLVITEAAGKVKSELQRLFGSQFFTPEAQIHLLRRRNSSITDEDESDGKDSSVDRTKTTLSELSRDDDNDEEHHSLKKTPKPKKTSTAKKSKTKSSKTGTAALRSLKTSKINGDENDDDDDDEDDDNNP